MVPSDSSWARPIATSGEAAVWLADLDAADAGERALAVLSEDERARAARFVFDVHRRRFIAGRAWLRGQLGERVGRAAHDVRFEYGPVGKPSLAGGEALRFNLSHSDRYALLAMAEGAEVGVDIERLRPLSDMDALAERVFSGRARRVGVGAGRPAAGGVLCRLDPEGGLHQGPRGGHRPARCHRSGAEPRREAPPHPRGWTA